MRDLASIVAELNPHIRRGSRLSVSKTMPGGKRMTVSCPADYPLDINNKVVVAAVFRAARRNGTMRISIQFPKQT